MIIIKSQDGKCIDKAVRIKLAKNDRFEIRGWGMDSLWNVLGFYETEERAKEVMFDIEYHIEKYYDSKKIIFTMPKE